MNDHGGLVAGPLSLTDVLRGAFADGPRLLPRISSDAASRTPRDTVAASHVPAGARLEFIGDARAVSVDLSLGARPAAASPRSPSILSVWIGDALVTTVPVEPGTVTVELGLPERAPEQIVTVFLPELDAIEVTDLSAIGGVLMPAPRGPRWIAYGDSITQGWSTTDPGFTWPARAGRALGVDVHNRGFAGSARGELPVALELGATPADVFSLAWGTNAWSMIPVDAASIAATTSLFIRAIRSQQSDVPIVVISPIVRPAAESTTNVFGATQGELRAAIESTVLALAAHDAHLELIPGGALVPAGLLVDGIHPGDEGHHVMADAVAPVIRRALSRG